MENELNQNSADQAGKNGQFDDFIERAHANVNDTDYFVKRGLDVEIIDTFRLGYVESYQFKDGDGWTHKPAVIIPYGTNNNYYIARSTDGKYFDKPDSRYAGKEPVYLEENLDEERCPCFITESQIDALSIIQSGGQACAIGGAGSGKLMEHIRKNKPWQPLILSFDDDPEGQNITDRASHALDDAGIDYIIAKYDLDKYPKTNPLKDANDLLQSNPAQLIHDVTRITKEAYRLPMYEESVKRVDQFVNEIFSDRYEMTPCGIKAIDRMLGGGLIPQTLTILTGPSGTAKTSIATNIFESLASRGNRCLFINLEMSESQLMARSIARLALVLEQKTIDPIQVLQANKADPDTAALIRRMADQYKTRVAPCLVYNPGWNTSDVKKILRRLDDVAMDCKRENKPAPNVAIDYLQLLTSETNDDAATILKTAVTGLKKYAMANDCFVLAISAQSRAVNKTGTVTQAAGRDSSVLEYSADYQIQLIRGEPGDTEEEQLKSDVVRAVLSKSRFTATDADGVRFRFHGGQSLVLPEETRYGSGDDPTY